MAIPILYWMLECEACHLRWVVHDCYLEYIGSEDADPEGEGYGGRPLEERYPCPKGCAGPPGVIGSLFSPDDEVMWLFSPHEPRRLSRGQRDEWRTLIARQRAQTWLNEAWGKRQSC